MPINGKKPLFDVLEDHGIIVYHPAIQTYFNRRVGNEQILTLVTIEILDPPLFIPITTAEIATNLVHGLSPRVQGSTNLGGQGM